MAGRSVTLPIERLTLSNNKYRDIIHSGPNGQVTVMSIKPGEEVGLEVHHGVDQVLVVESGRGRVYLNNSVYEVERGDLIYVDSGTKHNIINFGSIDLKMFSFYSKRVHYPEVSVDDQNRSFRTPRYTVQLS